MVFHVCDRLLRYVFLPGGVNYCCRGEQQDVDLHRNRNSGGGAEEEVEESSRHHHHNARSCTFGTLAVDWKNAFTRDGYFFNLSIFYIFYGILNFVHFYLIFYNFFQIFNYFFYFFSDFFYFINIFSCIFF